MFFRMQRSDFKSAFVNVMKICSEMHFLIWLAHAYIIALSER